jgi:hypothetical protein
LKRRKSQNISKKRGHRMLDRRKTLNTIVCLQNRIALERKQTAMVRRIWKGACAEPHIGRMIWLVGLK